MRSLESAIQLSHATSQKLQVVWLLSNDFNCRFDNLFLMPKCIDFFLHIDNTNFLGKKIWRVYKKILKETCQTIFEEQIEGILEGKTQITDDNSHRNIFIMTYSQFFGKPPFYESFIPIDSLQIKIDQIAKNLKDAVGVHIRRRDNRRSVKFSPTWKFIDLMEEECRKNEDVRFFVATDTPEEKECLDIHFPNRIIYYGKETYDRNSTVANQDALIDLFCLSKCKKIIGSYWSSFSITAADIGKIELVVAEVTD